MSSGDLSCPVFRHLTCERVNLEVFLGGKVSEVVDLLSLDMTVVISGVPSCISCSQNYSFLVGT